jgi:hypothetical protein
MFVKGYTTLSERAPERLRKLEARITRFEQQLEQAGVDRKICRHPSPALGTGKLLTRCMIFLLLLGRR